MTESATERMDAGKRLDVARRLGPPVQELGEGFMVDPATRAAGRALGYPGWPFYFAGRAGVLGPASAAVVAAALAFFPQPFVRAQWDIALSIGPIEQAVSAYAASCRRWGREHLDGVRGLGRLCALGSRVIDGASRIGRPLFAGWAAVELPDGPDDDPGRAAQLLHVLRELRGGAHVLAIAASGLDPLTAVLIDPESGVDGARYFRWPQPFRTPTPDDRRRWAEAVRRTDALVAAELRVLDAREIDELADLVRTAHLGAFGAASQAALGSR